MNYVIVSIMLSGFVSFIIVFRNRLLNFFYYVVGRFTKIYRVLNVRKRGIIVWSELISLLKNQKLHFGQFENERYVLATLSLNEETAHQFKYQITEYTLEYHTFILNNFEEHKTAEIMILATHLNNLYTYGKVMVNTKNNYVDFVHSGNLVTYMLYPGEIDIDLSTHYNIAKECHWAFMHLIATDEDPVFVIAELIKKLDEEEKNQSN